MKRNLHKDNNLLRRMKGQVYGSSQHESVGRILPNSGWRRIPSVSNFQVGKSVDNEILNSVGIKLKTRDAHEFEKTSTDKCNKYMKYQLNRIRKYRKTNPKLAWRIVMSCLKNSSSFRASGMNHVFSGWYYNMDLNSVKRISRRVNHILRSMDVKMDYHRVYIPKPNGKMRPLGVPTPEWRVSMHMVNNMLVEMLGHLIGKDQHAYQPGKGVMSAWRSILSKLDKYDFIYETDLKGYFDTVDSTKIVEIMRKNGAPDEITDYIRGICMSPPKLKSKDSTNEDSYRKRIDFLSNEKIEETEIGKDLIKEYKMNWNWWLKNNSSKPKEQVLSRGFEFLMKLWAQKDSKVAHRMSTFFDGVPQGGPLSPFLSNLPLHEGYLHQGEHVSYADDHIFFLNSEIEIKDNPDYNIHHAPEKCKWIKKNGKYTEEGIKFLGFRYSPYKEGVFYAEPRNRMGGAIHKDMLSVLGLEKTIMKLDTVEDIKVAYERFKGKVSGDIDSYKMKLSEKKVLGFVMSCMTLNDWKNDHSSRDIREALKTKYGKAHPKSLMEGKIPMIEESSTYADVLLNIVKHDIRKRKVSMKRGPKSLFDIRREIIAKMSRQGRRGHIENLL